MRQLTRMNRTDQAAFDALRKRHNEQWLAELTAAANYFALLSGVVNAFEVAAPPFPEARWVRVIVDPDDPVVFTFKEEIVAANRFCKP